MKLPIQPQGSAIPAEGTKAAVYALLMQMREQASDVNNDAARNDIGELAIALQDSGVLQDLNCWALIMDEVRCELAAQHEARGKLIPFPIRH